MIYSYRTIRGCIGLEIACCGLAMARLRENHRKKKERAFEEEGELIEPRRKLVSAPFLDPDLASPFLDDPDPGLARRVVKRRIWRFDAFFAKGWRHL
ncbi:hypothetical protein B296_00058970 [Ensete ventricosum]|uniref:Uncharacterized protein n=1 Tax=Ensete ventricosum TaxID=4639 RepID=A0A426XJK9_ENSVE|nr:hypothetical protein B296_00058970 [Ensete ventricosum]